MRNIQLVTNNEAKFMFMVESSNKSRILKFIYFDADWAHDKIIQMRYIGPVETKDYAYDTYEFTTDNLATFIQKLENAKDYLENCVLEKGCHTIVFTVDENFMTVKDFSSNRAIVKDKPDWRFTLHNNCIDDFITMLKELHTVATQVRAEDK